METRLEKHDPDKNLAQRDWGRIGQGGRVGPIARFVRRVTLGMNKGGTFAI